MCLAELKAGISLGRFHDSVSALNYNRVFSQCVNMCEMHPLIWDNPITQKSLEYSRQQSKYFTNRHISSWCKRGMHRPNKSSDFLILASVHPRFFLLTFVSHFSLFKCRPTQTKPVCLQARLVWRRQNGNCSFPNCSNYTNVFFSGK